MSTSNWRIWGNSLWPSTICSSQGQTIKLKLSHRPGYKTYQPLLLCVPVRGSLQLRSSSLGQSLTRQEYNVRSVRLRKAKECNTSPSRGDSLYRDQQGRGRVWDVAQGCSPRCYYSPAPSHHRRTTPETRRALWCDDGRDQSSDEDQDDWGHRELYRYCSPGQGEHCAHWELLSGLQFFIKRFCITVGPSSPWLPETELKILRDGGQAGLDLMGHVPAMQTFQGHVLDGLLPTARRGHTAIVKDLHPPGDLDRPSHGTPSSPRKDSTSCETHSSPKQDSIPRRTPSSPRKVSMSCRNPSSTRRDSTSNTTHIDPDSLFMNLGFSLYDQNCDDSHTQGTTTASGPAAEENGIPILQHEQTKVVKQHDLMASLVQLDPPELTPAVTTASTPAMSAVSQNTVSGTLNMHDGRFQNYEPFHHLSVTENMEARMAAYCTLINSMLISNSRDNALVDVPAQVYSSWNSRKNFRDNKTNFRRPTISSVCRAGQNSCFIPARTAS